MLFNSYIFTFVFLPTTLLGYAVFGRLHPRLGIGWLVAASLFFYGWWNPAYLVLFAGSTAGNFGLAWLFERFDATRRTAARRALLVLGVSANLSVLGWYKYAGFFVENLNAIADTQLPNLHIVLPLAISFFTFQQIAYLVDAYRGETRERRLSHYSLFVCFFPQLIAGPIVHHKEILSQFEDSKIFRLRADNFAIGASMFFLGLFKKTVCADGVAQFSNPVFDAARDGTLLTSCEAWQGALAYSMQLYFDFSGYSDMAIGLGRMFGVKLPLNFHSPYKATNIIDFWRRWHITLSRFLRDYLYVPLGGNRKGKRRRYVNLILTMLLGGLWHGAAWNFVIWGGLHGMFLVVNHAWAAITRPIQGAWMRGRVATAVAVLLTFVATTLAWVFFRAEGLSAALSMLGSMAGFGAGGSYTNHLLPAGHDGFAYVVLLLVIVWGMPNTQQLMDRYEPALDDHLLADRRHRGLAVRFAPNLRYALLFGVIGLMAIMFITRESEFLYFQF